VPRHCSYWRHRGLGAKVQRIRDTARCLRGRLETKNRRALKLVRILDQALEIAAPTGERLSGDERQ